MTTITEDELIRALEEAQNSNEDIPGVTIDEMRIATGYGEKKVRRILKQISRDGRLVVRKRQSISLSGDRCHVPVYSVKP